MWSQITISLDRLRLLTIGALNASLRCSFFLRPLALGNLSHVTSLVQIV